MTMRLQEGGDPLWGPFIYDGNNKGEHVTHSLGNDNFVKYTSAVIRAGKTWTGPMPESKDPPLECGVTVGIPAAAQLARDGDEWVIQPAPN